MSKVFVFHTLLILLETTSRVELFEDGSIMKETDLETTESYIPSGEDRPGAIIDSSSFVSYGSLHTLKTLSYWANKEEEILEALDNKIKLIDEEAALISRYIKDYEESSAKAFANAKNPNDTSEQRGHKVGSSAVLSHLMTNRFASTINALRELWMSTEYQDVQDNYNGLLKVQMYSNDSKWPNSEDLYLSNFAITQTQEIQNDEPKDMYTGATHNTTFGGQFKAVHCVKLGIIALNRGQNALAVKWLELAITILETNDESVPIEIVVSYLHLATQQHNSRMNYEDGIDVISNSFVRPIYADEQNRFEGRSLLFQLFGKKYMDSSSSKYNMVALCNNHEFQPESVRLKMNCFRYHGGNPYFILNPLNAEKLSENPPIVQYYNVLSETLMKELIDIRGNMRLSTVLTKNGEEKASTLSSRSSAGTTVHEEYSTKIWELTYRLTGFVGMEPTQTVEYVYGRMYLDHFDSLTQLGRNHLDSSKAEIFQYLGDRLATVLYYVDVPVDGGNTPFCEVGISARPVRGSAVFWFNLYRNGTPRFDVSHGACPVLHGHKTIINQWIRYNANFDTWKCSLKSTE